MIGKMYRPQDIRALKGKRGFLISHRMKSNFGGEIEFNEEIFLDFNYKEKTEVLRIDLSGLNVNVEMVQNKFNVEPTIIHSNPESGIKSVTFEIVDNSKSVIAKTDIKINTLRKLNRPNRIKTADGILEMSYIITSPKDTSKEEIIVVKMEPVIKQGKEVFSLTVTSNTPVVLTTQKKNSVERINS